MRVLVVEDEIKLGRAIKRGLEQEGYAVDLVHDAGDGQAYAESEDYDVIILDRMLPGGQDGLDICRKLRQRGSNTPVIMLTARDAVPDRIQGLDDGADDYLIKPFAFAELIARIHALGRRPKEVIDTELQFGNITLHTNQKAVLVDGKPVQLSKKEFALLEYFAHHPNQILSKQQLIQHVWDFDADILPNTVEVFVRSLRQKLGPDVIETVRGFGYRLKGKA
ncbi:MAG TPA: response regulator transcription factor [Candidatus Limnocylindria bacterium]|nr:response regulator transcription factor [Candidatus Limnocylindria bacterium]